MGYLYDGIGSTFYNIFEMVVPYIFLIVLAGVFLSILRKKFKIFLVLLLVMGVAIKLWIY